MNRPHTPPTHTIPNKTTNTRTKSWQEKSIGKLANTVEKKIANRSSYENKNIISSGHSICADSIFSDISLLSRPQLADSPPRPQHTTIASSSNSNSNNKMNLDDWVDSQQKIYQKGGTHDMCNNSVLTDEMNNEQLQQRQNRGGISTKHDGYRLPKPPSSSRIGLPPMKKKSSPSSPTSVMSRKVIATPNQSPSKSSADNSIDSPCSKSKSTADNSIESDESNYDTTSSSGGYNSPEQSVSTRSSSGSSSNEQINDVSYWKAAKMRAKLLKTNNDKLQSENQRLSIEFNTLSNHHSMEIKKLEMELQAERNRRLQISHEVSLKQAEHELFSEKLSNIESAKTEVSRRLDDTVNELYNAKSQLMKTSHELSKKRTEIDILNQELSPKADMSRQLEDTTNELSHVKSLLSTSQEDLVNVKEDLHMTKAELKIEKTTLRQQENECAYLYENNGRIKKEHSDAIQIVQMYKAEVDRFRIDIDETKQELESALSDSRHYKSALDNAQKEVHAKGEQLRQARHQVKEMIRNHDKNLSTLEEIASTEKKIRKDTQAILEDTQGKLSIAERANEELRESLTSVRSEKASLETKLSATEDLYDRLHTVLRPIPEQLEALLPSSELIEVPTQDALSNLEPEYLSDCISKLIGHIGDYSKELNESIKSRDDTLEETRSNLLNTADHLDKLETEHDMIKTELQKQKESLCQKKKEYSYMCDQYSELTAKVKSDKIALQKRLTNVFSELEAQHADVRQFKQSLDKTQKDLDSKDKQLCQAQYQVEELREKYDKLKRGSLREKKTRVDAQGKLSVAETRVDGLNQKVSELSCKLREYETPLITRVVDLKNAFLGGGSEDDMSDITELNK